MDKEKLILKKLDEFDKRISKIEGYLEISKSVDSSDIKNEKLIPDFVDSKVEMQEHVVKENVVVKQEESSISFNQVITFLGVVGIIIGVFAFYFYAVAQGWIGKSAQIGIGVIFGFILFGFAYFLRDKNEMWSNMVFGGSYFIEYLSIGVGVLEFNVMPGFLGLLITLIFLSSSLMLSIKFNSRIISYFSLVGGYLIPIICGFYENDLFIMSFYTLFSIALVLFSFKVDFKDLRFVSFIVISIFLSSFSYKLINASELLIPIFFLIVLFVLYNVSSMISAFRKQEGLSVLDSIVIGILPVVFLPILYGILEKGYNISLEMFGLIIMLLSFVYLGEIGYFKSYNKKLSMSMINTLLATGFITINLGFLFLIHSINYYFYMVLFAIEWFLFSNTVNKVKEVDLYKVFSYIFLFLTLFEYFFIVRFNHGLVEASFFMLFFMLIEFLFYNLFSRNIDYKINAGLFLIFGFALIYSFKMYLLFFINNSLANVILSIMWLVYTLFMYSKVFTENGKYLVGILLSITLLKIVFVDLMNLHGAYRIIGFIIFGILLLIGGYFIKNEDK